MAKKIWKYSIFLPRINEFGCGNFVKIFKAMWKLCTGDESGHFFYHMWGVWHNKNDVLHGKREGM